MKLATLKDNKYAWLGAGIIIGSLLIIFFGYSKIETYKKQEKINETTITELKATTKTAMEQVASYKKYYKNRCKTHVYVNGSKDIDCSSEGGSSGSSDTKLYTQTDVDSKIQEALKKQIDEYKKAEINPKRLFITAMYGYTLPKVGETKGDNNVGATVTGMVTNGLGVTPGLLYNITQQRTTALIGLTGGF